MKPTLIFDWDGTLHEIASLYGNAVRTAYAWLVEQNAAPERYHSDEEINGFLGMTAPEMWSIFMPDLDPELRAKASNIIGQDMIQAISRGGAHLYPHTESVLDELANAGHKMIFLSNCAISYLEAHRTYFKLDRWFCDYYCAEAYNYTPKVDVFPYIAEKHNGNFIMIGDRASDIRVGTTHGFPTIGCTYGYGHIDELSQATCIARSITDLPALIAELS